MGRGRFGANETKYVFIPLSTLRENLAFLTKQGWMTVDQRLFYFRRATEKGKEVLRLVPFSQIIMDSGKSSSSTMTVATR